MQIEWQVVITVVTLIVVPLFGVMIALGKLLQREKTQGENILDIKQDLHELCDTNVSDHRRLWEENDNKNKRISNLEGYRNGQRNCDKGG